MEIKKFVFESILEYLENSSLNEASDVGEPMTLESAKELVDEIMKKNIELYRIKYKSHKDDNPRKKASIALVNGEFGKAGMELCMIYAKSGSSNHIATRDKMFTALGLKGKDQRGNIKELEDLLKNMGENDAIENFKGILEVPKLDVFIGSKGLETIILWNLLEDSEKDKVYGEFYKIAMKRGYDTVESLKNGPIEKIYKRNIREGKTRMISPGISVNTLQEIEDGQADITEPKENATMILPPEKMDSVFNLNKTGFNGREDFMDDAFNTITENLGIVFKKLASGEISEIKSIKIYTSSDRFRNTEDAENLSWGQLSYARALSIAGLVRSIAEANHLNPSLLSQIHKLIEFKCDGSNGDGTSGPNPPDGFKFGYYVKDGNGVKFVSGKERDDTVIINTSDSDGSPTDNNENNAKIEVIKPESNKDSYNKFRYNNIEVIYEITETQKIEAF